MPLVIKLIGVATLSSFVAVQNSPIQSRRFGLKADDWNMEGINLGCGQISHFKVPTSIPWTNYWFIPAWKTTTREIVERKTVGALPHRKTANIYDLVYSFLLKDFSILCTEGKMKTFPVSINVYYSAIKANVSLIKYCH